MLPGGLRHGPAELLRVGLVVAAPFFPQGRFVLPGLAAGGARADVRASVLVPCGAVERVGPRRDRLRLERLDREIRGHLGRKHPADVVLQRHGLDLPVRLQHPQCVRRFIDSRFRRGGRRRHSRLPGRGRGQQRQQRAQQQAEPGAYNGFFHPFLPPKGGKS